MRSLRNKELDSSVIDWPVHMQRALDLATNVLTATPNPRVGCVIVNNEQVVAEGWHLAAGYPHAEAMALANATQSCQGGTAFVSLEPCNHQGRTGPCTEALIEAGVESVVIAMRDPNAEVAGGGIESLEAAGIEVFHLQDYQLAAEQLNKGFVKRWQSGKPWLRMKLAMSLDGRTALANGESKWITDEVAREDVQRLRATSSAIITGVGTVLVDDPRLTIRTESLGLSEAQLLSNQACLDRQPLRVLLDSKLQAAPSARIFNEPGSAVVYTTSDPSARSNKLPDSVDIRQLDSRRAGTESGVDLPSMLESLAADYSCNEVLVEAGPTLCGAFLESGLVDELVIYIAPKILGADARPLLQIDGIESLANSYDFEVDSIDRIGGDIKVVLNSLS